MITNLLLFTRGNRILGAGALGKVAGLSLRALQNSIRSCYIIMAKKNNSILWPNRLALGLLLLAVLLTLIQFIFKTYFDIDLGITFFGHEIL